MKSILKEMVALIKKKMQRASIDRETYNSLIALGYKLDHESSGPGKLVFKNETSVVTWSYSNINP